MSHVLSQSSRRGALEGDEVLSAGSHADSHVGGSESPPPHNQICHVANLCWNCDAKVHSANFLVERHSRFLLCKVCHSPTSWSASGAKLGFAASLCGCCVADTGRRRQEAEAEESQGESRDEEPGSEDSSHGGEEGEVFLKRSRETNPDPFSDDDRGSSLLRENSCKLPPSATASAFAGSLSTGMTRPMKIRKREDCHMGRFV
nr:putative zinc finger protein CONSTANS-LIKE 11 [Ipomoea batatas]